MLPDIFKQVEETIQCGRLGEGVAERGYTFAPVAVYDGFIPVEIVPQAKLFALVRKILV
jgi:hypothetical protein